MSNTSKHTNYTTYPAYKPSGVEWLDDVPAHWNTSRICYQSWVRARLGWKGLKAEEYVEDGYVFLATPNIKGKYIDFENVNFIDEQRYNESPEIIIKENDVLLAKDGSTLGTVNIVRSLPRPATVNSSIAVITPYQSLDGTFLYYLFQSHYLQNTIQRIKGGMGVPHLFQADLNKFDIPLPLLLEQQAIANFLDTKTTIIDDLIAKKERQIELMKEKRTALINKAVTKGLNPDAPMKDSGIEWLEDVPEHWDVKRLRFVVEMNPSKSETRVLDKNTLVSFLPMESIGTDGSLNLMQEKAICEVDTGYTFVREGDVTIAKITPCFENGKGAVMRGLLNGYGFGTTELIVARPREEKTISEYLHLLFTSSPFRKYGESHMYGAGGQKRVPDDFVRNFTIAFPPLSEQNAIVNFLANETAKIDSMIDLITQHITKLREYRQTLITAAVTGKIDVREAVSAS